MTLIDTLKERLKIYSRDQIIISNHAFIRMVQRQITEEEIIENILNPRRLEYVVEEDVDKFDCYFGYSKTLCHRYIIVLKNNLIVVTAIKINRRWQSAAERRKSWLTRR